MARVASSRAAEGGKVVEPIERKRSNYNENRCEAEKPFKERKRIRGRDGETPLRKYHMTEGERKKLIADAAATGGVCNPLKGRLGAYWGQVEALILLGADEYHSLKKIQVKMEEIMSAIPKKKEIAGKMVETTLWGEFWSKGSRKGAAKPKDGLGRIEQNFKVLQRLPREDKFENNPYGIKLSQFGMCVDMDYREMSPGVWIPFVRLNTKEWQPDEDGTVIKPYYCNPGSKRKKKIAVTGDMAAATPIAVTVEPSALPSENVPSSEIAAVENSVADAAVDSAPVPTSISDAEAVEAVEVARDIMENGEQTISDVLTTPAEDTGLKVAPDDFEQQIADYESEKGKESA